MTCCDDGQVKSEWVALVQSGSVILVAIGLCLLVGCGTGASDRTGRMPGGALVDKAGVGYFMVFPTGMTLDIPAGKGYRIEFSGLVAWDDEGIGLYAMKDGQQYMRFADCEEMWIFCADRLVLVCRRFVCSDARGREIERRHISSEDLEAICTAKPLD